MTKDEKIRAYHRAISDVAASAVCGMDSSGDISIDSINALRLLVDRLDDLDPINNYAALMPTPPEEYRNEVQGDV